MSLHLSDKVTPDSRVVLEFLEDAEDRLEELSERIKQVQARRMSNDVHKNEQIDQHLDDSHKWLRTQEQRVETLIDRGEIKLHLAKMDARDRLSGLLDHIDQIRTNIDHVVEHVSLKAADRLKRISDACLTLRNKITTD